VGATHKGSSFTIHHSRFQFFIMFKKILLLLVVALSFGSFATIQAQSVTVNIGGSTTGAPLTVTATKTDITCNGAADGTVTGVAAGGNGTTYAYVIALASTPLVPIANNTTGLFTGLSAGTYVVSAGSAGSCTATATSVTVAEPTALTVSVTASANPTCFGGTNGTITALAAGGSTGTTTYTIAGTPAVTNVTGAADGAFTGLPAGVYTITATKNTCTATTTPATTLTAPAQLTAAVSGTLQIACGATTASATVTASGGTSSYTYGWPATTVFTPANPASGASTATGLIAGTYNVTVTDANGCATTPAATAVVITELPTLSATVTTTQIVCNAGSPGAAGSTKGAIAVTAVLPSAATPTYAWSNSTSAATATNLDAGAYSVTISATGYCPVDYGSTINAAPVIVSADASSVTADGCQLNAGSVILTGKGGASGATYEVKWTTATLTTATPARPAAVGTPASGTYQASPATFTGLTGGYSYKFVIKDNAGCTTPE
jgi:SprB repeat